jgi:molybdate transport repressor ModE-like protein
MSFLESPSRDAAVAAVPARTGAERNRLSWTYSGSALAILPGLCRSARKSTIGSGKPFRDSLMFKVAIDTHWQLRRADGTPLVPRLTTLLVGIQRSGTLAAACRSAGLTYRYAWGLLREGERAFGCSLVESQRGRGARLTSLGERLAWADQRISARLAPMLDSLASEVEAEIERALSQAQPVLRLQASHGFAVETMRQLMIDREIPLDLKYRTSDEVLGALADRQCDLIGLHLPIGLLEPPAAAHYAERIGADWSVIHLATRRQGLIVAAGNPRRIRGLDDLTRRGLRFVNRQPGSGTRLLFDLVLQHAGIDGRAIEGYESVEYTHAAVAAYIGSGMADVGFGLEVPARRFGLGFVPLLSERYFFVCRDELLGEPVMRDFLAMLGDAELRAKIARLPGYDPAGAGRIEPAREVFPAVRARPRGARRA